MGNTLLDEQKKEDPVDIFQQWIEQNPDLVGREVLSHNKLFESNHFKYCEKSIKLAVYFRRDQTPLQDYLRAFDMIKSFVEFHKCMNILPMRMLNLRQFDKKQVRYEQNFAVAIRQYLHMTLQQRLESRPTLSQQQKLWFIYQMLFTVYTIHETFNIYHGNIRTSNFLVSSYQYLFLTDFATYKPNYILQDTEQGLSQFRLFYSSSVEKCNLAPQKLSGRDNTTQQLNSKRLFSFLSDVETQSSLKTSDTLKKKLHKKNTFNSDQDTQKQINKMKKMDIFSLGLAILEVINDGNPPLSYQSLLKGKKEGLNFQALINQSIQKIPQAKKQLEQILKGMLCQEAQKRPNIINIQRCFSACLNIEIYLLFWCCLSAFNKSSFSSCDLRIHLLFSIVRFIEVEVMQTGYQFVNSPPRCLSGFNSLKIFAEMIEKGLIYAPGVNRFNLIDKMLKHFDKTELHQEKDSQEEIVFEDEDERRKFFINTSKKLKIAKRMSFVVESKPKKQLCPPNYNDISHLLNTTKQHIPLKLTHIGLKPSRLQELINSYKINQIARQNRQRQMHHYQNCQIIIKIIFSCVRGCKYIASKLLAMEMIQLIAKDCSDHVLLHILIPYFINLAQDVDITVAKQAFLTFLSIFYLFKDPFHCQEDIHYFQRILDFFIGIIKQSKLRFTLFSHFKEVYQICEWLQIHYKRFNRLPKLQLNKIIEVIKVNYGSYSREQIKMLLSNNIPQHILPDMFQFYISLINTDRLQGLKLSVNLAKSLSISAHKHILDAFDSCIESGLDQYGIGLFYSIQYFTIRKSTSYFLIRKISIHVVNPNKWIRQEALAFVMMCLEEYPPTKNYFFFRQIFQAPFPLKPEDLEFQVLLPNSIKESQIDIKEKKLKIAKPNMTQSLFNEYLKGMKYLKFEKRKDDVDLWNYTSKKVRENQRGVLHFENYIKKQLELLYENNLLFYIFNMNSKFQISEREKLQEKGYPELLLALKKINRFSNDLSSIDHQKKELFQSFEGTINSSFQKLLVKRNKNINEIVIDKIKIAESIMIIGQVLCKFQMFKVKPIPKLGSYLRPPILAEKLIKPKGLLVSQIFEHTDTVTCLQKVADQYFLSGSSDGSLRIFDSKTIQLNITTSSIASIEIKGQNNEEKVKISSICAFDQTFAAIVGTNKGHIRIYPIERLPSGRASNRNDQIMKYNVNGQLQKLITFSNQLRNQCFCYVTAQGNLGIQDIRVKSRSMSCNIGRQRGIPKSLCATNRNSILVGTIDGYLINYDIRYNIISSVFQLHNDKETLPITGITPTPMQIDQKDQLFALTYPGKHYQFSYFDIFENKMNISPQRQFISANTQQIITTPYLKDKTNQEQFKLCRNGLIWRKNYDQLSDFNKNFRIYDYLSDPITSLEAKIRQVWLDNCKNRYNQISSTYNKKNLPFLEYLNGGILTSFNSTQGSISQLKNKPSMGLLVEKRQSKDYTQIQRVLNYKPNSSHKILTFSGEQTSQYFTCCKVLPSMLVMGCRNSLVKIYM